MSEVESVSTNIMHTVVLTKKKRVLAWGRATYFSDKVNGFVQTPIDVTDEFVEQSPIKKIKAGINYTVALREDNTLKIVGSETILQI